MFSYELPREKIAQRPVVPYDSARMLVADPEKSLIDTKRFSDLPHFLSEGDLLVLNNSKVVPARLFGTIEASERPVELLLLQQVGASWKAIARPLKHLTPGVRVALPGSVTAIIEERVSSREILLRLEGCSSVGEYLEQNGTMPIPPYIREGRGDLQDRVDYQPLLAKESGSVAAPTASLHFTQQLLSALAAKGIELRETTLHIGPASFFALESEEDGELTPPGSERYLHNAEILQSIFEAKERGSRVIAVGTTVMRSLESMALFPEREDGWFETDLFIQPGFSFRCVDHLVTNFHQPQTTHLLLVEAFMGRSLLERSYRFALENDYRFLSYGDGMFIKRQNQDEIGL